MAENKVIIDVEVQGVQDAQKDLEKVNSSASEIGESVKGVGESFKGVGAIVSSQGGVMGEAFNSLGESVGGLVDGFGAMGEAMTTGGKSGMLAFMGMLGPISAIAGALARHCEVLLFDEPTALLDGDTQIELVSQVQNLVKNRGIKALWVTHRLDELDYSDGAFLLEGGKVTDQGNALELKARLLASAAVES